MVFESSVAKKWLGQSEGGNAVGDDLDGLGRDGGADNLAKLAKSGLSRLVDAVNVSFDIGRAVINICWSRRDWLTVPFSCAPWYDKKINLPFSSSEFEQVARAQIPGSTSLARDCQLLNGDSTIGSFAIQVWRLK